jgi:tetratricopeptide (TPR) repeat protein
MPIGKRKQEEAKDNFRKGKQAFDEGDIGLAFKELHKALDYYQQTDEDVILAEIHRLLGSLYFDKGQLIDSRNYYKRAFKHFKNFGQKIAMADCYDKIAISFMVQSELSHAEDYQIKAINIRKKTPDKKGLARGLKNLAVIQYQLTNNSDKALALLEEALDLAKRANEPKLVASISLDQANILNKLERYEEAVGFYVIARQLRKKYSITLPEENN